MKIKIDKKKCIGCGLCASLCPDVFEMKDGKAHAKNPSATNPCVKEAAANCPVQAINLD